jgi:hypothetical protein
MTTVTVTSDFLDAVVELLEALVDRDFAQRGASDDDIEIEERCFDATIDILQKIRAGREFSRWHKWAELQPHGRSDLEDLLEF